LNVQVLVFDLGGVLVDYTGVRDIAPLLRVSVTEDEIRRHFATCPHVAAYCTGRLDRMEFGKRMVRDWGLAVSTEQFLQEFRTWSRGLLPGARELLSSLRERFRLAALSNSNELHWERHTNDIGVTALFEVAISSHQVGAAKPDPVIYQEALERLDVLPEAIMFFDDVPANVVTASALGMRAFQVEGVEALRQRLAAEGVLGYSRDDQPTRR
jgi:putative hydrolase of the HAD superfamily